VRYTLLKAEIHCTSFPVASPQQVGSLPSTGKLRGNVRNGFWACSNCAWLIRPRDIQIDQKKLSQLLLVYVIYHNRVKFCMDFHIFFTGTLGLTENGGPEKGGPLKNNRCESNDRKMQDHEPVLQFPVLHFQRTRTLQ